MPSPIPHWLQSPVNCPRAWRGWLLDRGSLTHRLQMHSGGDFSVTVLQQGWGKPRRDEALALGIPFCQHALIREVVLNGHGQPWVFARSVIPLQTLHGKLRFLRTLGDRPLGELLFRNPHIQRGPLFLAPWSCALLPATLQPLVRQPHGSPTPATLWARYSLFRHEAASLLVSEVFLPTLPGTPGHIP